MRTRLQIAFMNGGHIARMSEIEFLKGTIDIKPTFIKLGCDATVKNNVRAGKEIGKGLHVGLKLPQNREVFIGNQCFH